MPLHELRPDLSGGNRVKAAALLDISRTVLYEKMEQYQLK